MGHVRGGNWRWSGGGVGSAGLGMRAQVGVWSVVGGWGTSWWLGCEGWEVAVEVEFGGLVKSLGLVYWVG